MTSSLSTLTKLVAPCNADAVCPACAVALILSNVTRILNVPGDRMTKSGNDTYPSVPVEGAGWTVSASCGPVRMPAFTGVDKPSPSWATRVATAIRRPLSWSRFPLEELWRCLSTRRVNGESKGNPARTSLGSSFTGSREKMLGELPLEPLRPVARSSLALDLLTRCRARCRVRSASTARAPIEA